MKAETQLLVRLDPKLHRALQKIRQKTGTTVSDQVREAIRRWVDDPTPHPVKDQA